MADADGQFWKPDADGCARRARSASPVTHLSDRVANSWPLASGSADPFSPSAPSLPASPAPPRTPRDSLDDPFAPAQRVPSSSGSLSGDSIDVAGEGAPRTLGLARARTWPKRVPQAAATGQQPLSRSQVGDKALGSWAACVVPGPAAPALVNPMSGSAEAEAVTAHARPDLACASAPVGAPDALERAAGDTEWSRQFVRRWRHVRRRAYLQARGILVSSQSRGNLLTSGRSLDLLLNCAVDPDVGVAPASPAGSGHSPAGEPAD
ncbi:hypothetical protein WJX81_007943 [Elliptochloris bilobata]|uniref:Uncharacterized protein n=1 Tax=Elliptochloris bilobata TaxID=381761 RepID=A0AAW1QI62_9CHLO